jgi:hypothetical protein
MPPLAPISRRVSEKTKFATDIMKEEPGLGQFVPGDFTVWQARQYRMPNAINTCPYTENYVKPVAVEAPRQH